MLCLKVFTITTEQPDNCFEVNEDIAFAVNILQNSSNIYVVFRKFKMIESYFSYPCSSKALHIKKVSDLDKSLDVCHIIHIQRKIVLLPLNEKSFVALPLIHS